MLISGKSDELVKAKVYKNWSSLVDTVWARRCSVSRKHWGCSTPEGERRRTPRRRSKRRREMFKSLCWGEAVLGSLFLWLSWSIVACQLPEARPPVAEVGEILLWCGGERVDGAERECRWAGALESVRLEWVIRRDWQVRVGLFHLLPDIAFEQREVCCHGHRRSRSSLRAGPTSAAAHSVGLDPLWQGADVWAGVAALSLWEVIEVPQRAHVIRLSVLLPSALIVVLDDVIPHVLFILCYPLALPVAFQGQDQQDEY